MAALPTTTTAFASGATEAQFKTFLTGQRDYLVGLFGADGTAATAKTTLGVVAGVSSVNGNTGAVSEAQIAAAAVASWGYTPPNPSAVAAVSHTHSGVYTPTDSYGAVGEFSILYYSTGSFIGPGLTGAANLFRATVSSSGHGSSGVSVSGTWKNLTGENVVVGGYGLFQRIA